MSKSESALRCLILDIDGTLIDSNEAHLLSWAEAFRRFGIDVAQSELQKQIGKGSDHYVPEFLTARQMQRISKELKDLKKQLYLDDYRPEVKPFAGVRERLFALHEAGIRLVLASSSDEDDVQYSIGLLGIEAILHGSTSKDDVKHSKPSPEIFDAARQKAGSSLEETVTVGDTPYDIAASHRASLATAALLCGGFSREALHKAEFIFDDFNDFADHIKAVERSLSD
ncbi:MAG: HAD family hydrolase [Acidobacteriota bacterium]